MAGRRGGHTERRLRLAEEDAHSAGTAESRRALGALLAHQRSPAEGRERWSRALAEFQLEHDADGIGRTLEGLGYATRKQSDYEGVARALGRALPLGRARRRRRGISMAMGQIGLARWARGEHDLALDAAFEWARETAAAAGKRAGDDRRRATTLPACTGNEATSPAR